MDTRSGGRGSAGQRAHEPGRIEPAVAREERGVRVAAAHGHRHELGRLAAVHADVAETGDGSMQVAGLVGSGDPQAAGALDRTRLAPLRREREHVVQRRVGRTQELQGGRQADERGRTLQSKAAAGRREPAVSAARPRGHVRGLEQDDRRAGRRQPQRAGAAGDARADDGDVGAGPALERRMACPGVLRLPQRARRLVRRCGQIPRSSGHALCTTRRPPLRRRPAARELRRERSGYPAVRPGVAALGGARRSPALRR